MSDSDEEVRARKILRKYLDIRTTSNTTPPRASLPTKNKMKKQSPQEIVDEFWSKFNSKTPGKTSTLLPIDSYAKKVSESVPRGSVAGENASASYEDAVRICKLKVEKIVQECRRVNQKYRDPHFDIEFDLKWGKLDCLEMLAQPNRKKTIFKPGSVKRVGDIFEEPQFHIGPPSAKDIRQGQDGDCWLLAALCTLTNKPGLIERICVAKDEQVGVYGFVFYRDSEWRSEIIDDKLYLTRPDYDESVLERVLWEDRERVHSEDEYRKAYQTGSGALYFAQCENPNETWLPLLEKAYAKAHGDFAAIEGGFTGEGIEDLTGGVTVELFATDILDKEAFWKDELLHVNEDFLFGCATGVFKGWGERKGIKEGHAYSIMRAVEIDDRRLCLLKNPWGKGEWTGAWSDGSKEWTPEWMVKLDHRFGNDGAFWISYEDLLRKYQTFDRTRLFDDSWKVTHHWATLRVPWTVEYHDTKFAFTIDKPASVVVVLNQLNTRYFKGLAGQYVYELCFRLHKAGEDDYILRSRENYCQRRSVSAEVDLQEPGEYVVLIKITAIRDYSSLPVEQVVRENAKNRRDKLLRIGLAYDLAHAKGQFEETPDEKAARKNAEARAKGKERKEHRQRLMEEKKELKMKLRKQQKRENEKAKTAAAKEAKRQEKEIKQMAGNIKHTDCAECQKEDQERKENEAYGNAKQAAEIVRPTEPHPARDQASSEHTEDVDCECEECKRQAKPSDIEGPENEPIEHAGGKDTAENEMGTSEKTDEDHSSRNITFGDPRGHASLMPGIFPTSVRTSVVDVDVDGSNDSTAESYTKGGNESRRMSFSRTSSGGRSDGQTEGGTSNIVRLTSSNILDLVQLTYSPQIFTMDSRRCGVSVGQMEAPSPLVREVLQEDGDNSDSDVSSVCSSAVEEAIAKAHAPPPAPVQTEKEKKEEEKEEEDEFEKDPWNAVCVVGLRVYAKPLGCARVEKETRDVVAENVDKGSERERIDVLAKVDERVKQLERLEKMVEEIEEKRVWTPTSEDEKVSRGVCEDGLGSLKGNVAAAKVEESEMVGVTIRVVRPKSWEDGEASLDVDDSAMDATRDHDKARKESVMGVRGRLGSVQV